MLFMIITLFRNKQPLWLSLKAHFPFDLIGQHRKNAYWTHRVLRRLASFKKNPSKKQLE